MKRFLEIVRLTILDVIGILLIPTICFLFFLTLFRTEPRPPQNHGGLIIYLVGYFFFCGIYILPLQIVLSVFYVNTLVSRKYLIKAIPLSIWLFFVFCIQCPLFNANTEYNVFNSYSYSMLFLVAASLFMLFYHGRVKNSSVRLSEENGQSKK